MDPTQDPRGRFPFTPTLKWKRILIGLWLIAIALIKSNIIPSVTEWLLQTIWDSGIGYKLSPISVFTFIVLGYLAFSISRTITNIMAYCSYSTILTFTLCSVLILGVLTAVDLLISFVTGSPDLLIMPSLFSLAMGDFNTNVTATAGVINNSINISLS